MIYKSPQFNNEIKYNYQYEDETIHVLIGEDVIDTFDFTGFTQDGELDVSSVETSLPVNPIFSAKRENGILYVKLLNFIDNEASESDKFPDWEEVI